MTAVLLQLCQINSLCVTSPVKEACLLFEYAICLSFVIDLVALYYASFIRVLESETENPSAVC